MSLLDTGAVLKWVVSETIGDRESVTFRSIREARVPHGVTKFLFAQVLEATTRGQGVSEPRGPLTAALLRTMALEHRFERREYLVALGAATEFLSDYLIHPRESLLRWLTEGRHETSVALAEKKLAAIHDYRYLPMLIAAWLSRRKMSVVSMEQLRTVIATIDDRVVGKHSPEELGLLARPIFMFTRYGGSQEVQLSALREFYREKGLDSFWDGTVQRIGPGIQSVTLAGLMNALRSTGTPLAPEITTVPVSDPQPERIEAPESTGLPKETAVPERPLPTPAGRAPALPDLSSLILPDKKESFINSVFGRDADYYTAVIASLNGTSTWKEAALFLSQFYMTNGLDPFADEVVDFTDIVHHRYNPDDH